MRALLLLTYIIVLAACGGSDSVVAKQLSGSDSLVINFNTPQSNTIAKTMSTTEGNAIKKLIHFTDGKAVEAYKCGYDGNLMFYKNGALIGDVSFNYSGDGCRHFIMMLDDKLTPTAMSNEAANFLKSLAEGRGWY
ncbi:MAG TPA: hypothetical protein VN451_00665 [Chitinophagaceae bacterium]|nr:hypothetical protein [Chitinophagaceae bacterium]